MPAGLQDVTGGTTVGGATETLLINRPGPAAARQGSSLAPRPADSGRTAGLGGGDTDTVVLGGSKVAAGAASQQQQQHTAGLTDQLANRTSHTIHSGSTVGSDDPTATMRMKALSGRSGGSTGSIGEEATVCLRKPGSGGKDAAGGSSGEGSGRLGDWAGCIAHVMAGCWGCTQSLGSAKPTMH